MGHLNPAIIGLQTAQLWLTSIKNIHLKHYRMATRSAQHDDGKDTKELQLVRPIEQTSKTKLNASANNVRNLPFSFVLLAFPPQRLLLRNKLSSSGTNFGHKVNAFVCIIATPNIRTEFNPIVMRNVFHSTFDGITISGQNIEP